MNENFLVLDWPFKSVENGRINSYECAITSTIERDGNPIGSCIMFGELDTMRPDYESGKPKWHQPTSAQVYREQN
jgi:hypothetical protein